LDGPELPVFRKMVFVLHDQEWKDVRSSITPAFSSGKIKKVKVQLSYEDLTLTKCLPNLHFHQQDDNNYKRTRR